MDVAIVVFNGRRSYSLPLFKFSMSCDFVLDQEKRKVGLHPLFFREKVISLTVVSLVPIGLSGKDCKHNSRIQLIKMWII